MDRFEAEAKLSQEVRDWAVSMRTKYEVYAHTGATEQFKEGYRVCCTDLVTLLAAREKEYASKPPKKELSKGGRDLVAMALLLFKDWKADGKMDIETMKLVLELADHLGVRKEFDELQPKIPPMKITPR